MYARMQIELHRNPVKNTTVKSDAVSNSRLFGAINNKNNNTTQLGNGVIAARANIDPRIRAAYTPMGQIDFSRMSYEQHLEYKEWQIKAVIADRSRILRPPLPDFVKLKS